MGRCEVSCTHIAAPLPSEDESVLRTLTWKPRPGSGLDCLTCATFARQRLVTILPEIVGALRRRRSSPGALQVHSQHCLGIQPRVKSTRSSGQSGHPTRGCIPKHCRQRDHVPYTQGGALCSKLHTHSCAASERRGNDLKGFKNFSLEAKARI